VITADNPSDPIPQGEKSCGYYMAISFDWVPGQAGVAASAAFNGGGGGGGVGGGGVKSIQLILTATSDVCDSKGRWVNYELTTSDGTRVTSPQYYVYEIQSAQSLATGGPFPGTTYQSSNRFNDWINPGLQTGGSIQQFGISLSPPNASGVQGGRLVQINWFGTIVSQNNILFPSLGTIIINGKPCP